MPGASALGERLTCFDPSADLGHKAIEVDGPDDRRVPDHAGVGDEPFAIPAVELEGGGFVDGGSAVRMEVQP